MWYVLYERCFCDLCAINNLSRFMTTLALGLRIHHAPDVLLYYFWCSNKVLITQMMLLSSARIQSQLTNAYCTPCAMPLREEGKLPAPERDVPFLNKNFNANVAWLRSPNHSENTKDNKMFSLWLWREPERQQSTISLYKWIVFDITSVAEKSIVLD